MKSHFLEQKSQKLEGAACHGGKPLGFFEGAACHGGKPLGVQALRNVILWSRRAFQGTPGHEISFPGAEMQLGWGHSECHPMGGDGRALGP